MIERRHLESSAVRLFEMESKKLAVLFIKKPQGLEIPPNATGDMGQ